MNYTFNFEIMYDLLSWLKNRLNAHAHHIPQKCTRNWSHIHTKWYCYVSASCTLCMALQYHSLKRREREIMCALTVHCLFAYSTRDSRVCAQHSISFSLQSNRVLVDFMYHKLCVQSYTVMYFWSNLNFCNSKSTFEERNFHTINGYVNRVINFKRDFTINK